MLHKTKDVMSRLENEGWVSRQGKGDHVNYKKPDVRHVITIDSGEKEVPKGTYSRTAGLAGRKQSSD